VNEPSAADVACVTGPGREPVAVPLFRGHHDRARYGLLWAGALHGLDGARRPGEHAAVDYPARWLVFFAAWRSGCGVGWCGRIGAWHRGIGLGLARDVGVGAEAGGPVPVHDRVL